MVGAVLGWKRVSYHKRILISENEDIVKNREKLARKIADLQNKNYKNSNKTIFKFLLAKLERELAVLEEIQPILIRKRNRLKALIQDQLEMHGNHYWLLLFIYEMLFWLPSRCFLTRK
jgi:translation initiation factor 2 beta subunit (eIF-2beta)/eIF-5